MPDDDAAKYLTPVLKRFAPRHAQVEIELTGEQSTALIPRVAKGEIDLALVSRQDAHAGTRLFHEPLVWVGAPQFSSGATTLCRSRSPSKPASPAATP